MEKIRMEKIDNLRKIVLVIVSGMLLYLPFSLGPLAWLTWLAPVPILIIAFKAKPLQGLFYGALVGVMNLISFPISGGMDSLEIFILVALVLKSVVRWALSFFLTSLVFKRISPIMGVITFPAVHAVLDYLEILYSPFGGTNSVSFLPLDFLAALQLPPILGVIGINFMINLILSVISYIIYKKIEDKSFSA